jgi:malate dehydrogenase (oxaloacetate-decarboxylating)
MATGSSKYPNQINNALAFPGIFRGALEARIPQISEEMCIAASRALAGLIKPKELDPDYIIPTVFDSRVAKAVADAVKQIATANGTGKRALR